MTNTKVNNLFETISDNVNDMSEMIQLCQKKLDEIKSQKVFDTIQKKFNDKFAYNKYTNMVNNISQYKFKIQYIDEYIKISHNFRLYDVQIYVCYSGTNNHDGNFIICVGDVDIGNDYGSNLTYPSYDLIMNYIDEHELNNDIASEFYKNDVDVDDLISMICIIVSSDKKCMNLFDDK